MLLFLVAFYFFPLHRDFSSISKKYFFPFPLPHEWNFHQAFLITTTTRPKGRSNRGSPHPFYLSSLLTASSFRLPIPGRSQPQLLSRCRVRRALAHQHPSPISGPHKSLRLKAREKKMSLGILGKTLIPNLHGKGLRQNPDSRGTEAKPKKGLLEDRERSR